jgi:Mrp family chromosome partitioning ATPase
MSECNHNCSSCQSTCGEYQSEEDAKKALLKPQNKYSNIKKVIAVASGKGGVGKSMVTSLLAVAMRRNGYNVGILDADITGPSIPKTFGIHQMAEGTEECLYPTTSKSGIKLMSSNLLLDEETEPIIWRGPVIAGLVEQFWTDVAWGEVDYLFVDMPPGTGDVPLTVLQSLPVDGIVVVTSPQDLVSMIVGKAVNMAYKMDIPVLGIVENMSYFECPNCNEKHYIFGDSKIEELAAYYQIDTVSKMPIDPTIPALCDEGLIEEYQEDVLKHVVNKLKTLLK